MGYDYEGHRYESLDELEARLRSMLGRALVSIPATSGCQHLLDRAGVHYTVGAGERYNGFCSSNLVPTRGSGGVERAVWMPAWAASVVELHVGHDVTVELLRACRDEVAAAQASERLGGSDALAMLDAMDRLGADADTMRELVREQYDAGRALALRVARERGIELPACVRGG